MTSPARRLWQLIEPYHAVTYFNSECDQAYEEIGLRGFWRGYFAGRAAPLGEVGPAIVTACFFGFEPSFVARALPSIWSMTSPEVAIRARLDGADRALRRLLGNQISGAELAEAAALARQAIEGMPIHGRPLFAANSDLDWPDDAHLVLWHRLGAERTARLLALLGPIENELARNDAIRYPNPIGVSRRI